MKKFYSLFAALLLSATVFGQTTYQLVTSETDLVAGEKYLIASANDGSVDFLGWQNTNNRPQTTSAYTVASGQVLLTPASASTDHDSAYEITLDGSTGAWVLKDAVNGTVLGPATSGSSNHLKANTAATFTITIDSGTNAATMTAVTGTNPGGRNIIRYNSSAKLFACYSTGQNDVFLYKATTSLAVSDVNAVKSTLVKSTLVDNEISFLGKADVKVYNMEGKLVKSAQVSESQTLNVSNLNKGSYIVTGIVNGKTVSEKIIKK